MAKEIEKRFLLTEVPELPEHEGPYEYTHGFLPGYFIKERITKRSAGPPFVRVVKIGSGEERDEFTEELDEDAFHRFWWMTNGRRISGRRWKVVDEKLTGSLGQLNGKPLRWEVSQFTDRDLVLAEIELPVAGLELHPTEFPEWLRAYVVREVTGDSSYETFTLATKGAPRGREDRIQDLLNERTRLDKEIEALKNEGLCWVCGGPGVLRDMRGGFHKCFGCADESNGPFRLLDIAGRKWGWNGGGVVLFKLGYDRPTPWGGGIASAWFAETQLYPLLYRALCSGDESTLLAFLRKTPERDE